MVIAFISCVVALISIVAGFSFLFSSINASENEWWPEPLGWVLIIVGFLLFIVMAAVSTEETKTTCEDVGGEYLVIGEEYSASHKRTIDVYGCVQE